MIYLEVQPIWMIGKEEESQYELLSKYRVVYRDILVIVVYTELSVWIDIWRHAL